MSALFRPVRPSLTPRLAMPRSRAWRAALALLPAAALLLAVPAIQAQPTPAAGAVVTIVKVPRPWYAADFLIARAFRNAVPEYAAIDGLQRKYFTLAEDGRLGGIYLWRTQASAQAWFGERWQQRVRQRYGEPSIDWYTVERVIDLGAAGGDTASTVVTLVSTRVAATVPAVADGLRARLHLRDAQGRRSEALVWNNADAAIAAVGDRLSVQRAAVDPVSVRVPRLPSSLCAARSGECEVEYFEAPVVMQATGAAADLAGAR